MATVNQSSLRAEFDALKARFESLCAEGKMSADSRAMVDALLMLFEVLMAVFMEKHTPKSSANSSLPASQSPNDNTARTRPGAKGKGPSYNDARCANTRTRESVRVLTVDACQRCGEDLTDAACLGHERRTLIDIVFEKVVRHADAQIKHCPRCHAETRACFPHQMPGPLQYGPGIKAYLVHLLIAQMLSLKRVAQSMHALIGRTLSEATLLGYVAQLHHALAEWERHAIERLLASPAMHVDETSLRVEGKNHWIHVYSAGTLTVKCLHPKRGREAIEAIAILPRYAGVAVHDCWASYLSYAHCDHALCGAHLLRELAFIVDAHDYAWAIRVFIGVISRGIRADTARADPGKSTIQAGPQHGARILMTLEPMARDLGALLKKRGETVAVIESSTGGLISAALLSIPGASVYFVGGAVTYTGAARHALLALPAELPAETRSSSEPYARLGARAIRERLGSTWGLAETGAAGPSGNRYGDAAGHTCLAVCGPIERVLTLETGRDDREDNMWVFARTAIGLLYEAVRGV